MIPATACGARPTEPASEPPVREAPAEAATMPADPLADASPITARRVELRPVLADATLAFSLDPGTVVGRLKTMRESQLLTDLFVREVHHGYPVIEVLERDRVAGSHIDGALWSTPRDELVEALHAVEQNPEPWAMARAIPAAIVSHARIEFEIGNPDRTMERLAALTWDEPMRYASIPGYDWDDPNACAELAPGAWCVDRGDQVLVARTTASGIRLDTVHFYWPRAPLGIVAIEEIAGAWPHEPVELTGKIDGLYRELAATAAGRDPTIQTRVKAVKEALDRTAAPEPTLAMRGDLILVMDVARTATYVDGPYVGRGIQHLMAARLDEQAYQLVTGSPSPWKASQLEPGFAWEDALPAQPVLESVQIAWNWTEQGRRVDLRWRRNPAVELRADDQASPQARRAELCHEATACGIVGSRAASLLDVSPIEPARLKTSPSWTFDLDTAMLAIAGMWPHVVVGVVSGRIPTNAPAEATAALAISAPLGSGMPPRWGVSVAAPDATEAKALAAWGDEDSFGRGPVVDVGELQGHRVAISWRDVIFGVGQAAHGRPTGHLASSADRLAWLTELPWGAPAATDPDAFLLVQDMPALVKSARFWFPPWILNRKALARLIVVDQEVLLRIELADPVARLGGA